MKERPILFSGVMVRAILEGRKTQTRRILKPQPTNLAGPNFDGHWSDTIDPVVRYFVCPYGQAVDRLWVKETHFLHGVWRKNGKTKTGKQAWKFVRMLHRVMFPGGDFDGVGPAKSRTDVGWHKRPSIFMPRWASRIMLEVTSVRVERLNDISALDAMAEGIEPMNYSGQDFWKNYRFKENHRDHYIKAYRWQSDSYCSLWESINGAGSWALNPWVWVVEFGRIAA